MNHVQYLRALAERMGQPDFVVRLSHIRRLNRIADYVERLAAGVDSTPKDWWKCSEGHSDD